MATPGMRELLSIGKVWELAQFERRSRDAEPYDLVIVDAMFPVALVEAARLGAPSIVMCHTYVWRGLEMWRKMHAMLASLRAEAGFDPEKSSRRFSMALAFRK